MAKKNWRLYWTLVTSKNYAYEQAYTVWFWKEENKYFLFFLISIIITYVNLTKTKVEKRTSSLSSIKMHIIYRYVLSAYYIPGTVQSTGAE